LSRNRHLQALDFIENFRAKKFNKNKAKIVVDRGPVLIYIVEIKGEFYGSLGTSTFG
jgi:hypothetical protein